LFADIPGLSNYIGRIENHLAKLPEGNFQRSAAIRQEFMLWVIEQMKQYPNLTAKILDKLPEDEPIPCGDKYLTPAQFKEAYLLHVRPEKVVMASTPRSVSNIIEEKYNESSQEPEVHLDIAMEGGENSALGPTAAELEEMSDDDEEPPEEDDEVLPEEEVVSEEDDEVQEDGDGEEGEPADDEPDPEPEVSSEEESGEDIDEEEETEDDEAEEEDDDEEAEEAEEPPPPPRMKRTRKKK
jgi:hypothetical protein